MGMSLIDKENSSPNNKAPESSNCEKKTRVAESEEHVSSTEELDKENIKQLSETENDDIADVEKNECSEKLNDSKATTEMKDVPENSNEQSENQTKLLSEESVGTSVSGVEEVQLNQVSCTKEELNVDSEESGDDESHTSKSEEMSDECKTPEICTEDAANELLQSGKRLLIAGKYAEAANVLSQACKSFDNVHGEMANECGIPYYFYGCALLDENRIEAQIFGNAFKGIPDIDDEECSNIIEKHEISEEALEKIRDEVADALTEETEAMDVDAEGSKQNDEQKESEASKETSDNTEIEVSSSSNQSKEKQTNESEVIEINHAETDEKENENDEDDDDLKNAWQMFEVSRTIFERSDSVENKKWLSLTYKKLGEVLMETSHYVDASKEFDKCILLQENIFDKAERLLAETYFFAGLNMLQSKLELQKALKYFKESANILESVKKDSTSEEAKDIDSLLPKIQDHINDTENLVKTGVADIKESDSVAACKDSDATNVTHLVKRKGSPGLSPKIKKVKDDSL